MFIAIFFFLIIMNTVNSIYNRQPAKHHIINLKKNMSIKLASKKCTIELETKLNNFFLNNAGIFTI